MALNVFICFFACSLNSNSSHLISKQVMQKGMLMTGSHKSTRKNHKYDDLINSLDDEMLYTAASIARMAVEKRNLKSKAKRDALRTKIRGNLSYFIKIHDLKPDGELQLDGQRKVRAWFGKTLKNAKKGTEGES